MKEHLVVTLVFRGLIIPEFSVFLFKGLPRCERLPGVTFFAGPVSPASCG